MKKFMLFVLATIFTINFTFANQTKKDNAAYEKAMGETLQAMGEAKDAAGFLAVANRFSRIANAEQEEWLAWYYMAYNYVIVSFIEKDGDKRDAYTEQAQAALDKAMEISKDNSELLVMQGYIYMAQTSISPMIRGMMYGPKTAKVLEKAIKLDPNNPRAHFLKGENTYYTPSMFGGGADSAKPHFEKAGVLYEEVTVAENNFMPNWGGERNAKYLEKYEVK